MKSVDSGKADLTRLRFRSRAFRSLFLAPSLVNNELKLERVSSIRTCVDSIKRMPLSIFLAPLITDLVRPWRLSTLSLLVGMLVMFDRENEGAYGGRVDIMKVITGQGRVATRIAVHIMMIVVDNDFLSCERSISNLKHSLEDSRMV
jgi:hypothetical protein